MTPTPVHEPKYLALASLHTQKSIEKIYADKGYYGWPNRVFLHLNKKERIMRKDTSSAELTEYERKRNKKISKIEIDSGTVLWVESFA